MGKKRARPSKNESKDNTDDPPSTDWIAELARKAAGEAPTKAERVERRLAKKLRRKERITTNATVSERPSAEEKEKVEPQKKPHPKAVRWELARRVADKVKESAQAVLDGLPAWKRTLAYEAAVVTNYKKRHWNEESIQPRRRDYGGIGLARPSMFLDLDDPSFAPKLEEEFAEHIPGFFGKQRTKAMKKQLDSNMLWRKLAEKKTGNLKVDGKKLANMSPDERVEAMIKSGML